MTEKTLIQTKNLQKYFPVKSAQFFSFKKEYVKANKNITLDIKEGETLGMVGESGCGKSTFGRTVIQLQKQTGGSSIYFGESLTEFMPHYVIKVIQKMPQTMGKYATDLNTLKTLKKSLKNLQATTDHDIQEADDIVESYRLLKIDFENTYYNTFRVVGGLLAHPDLKRVQKVMRTWYFLRRKKAQAERRSQAPSDDAALLTKIQKLEAELETLKKEAKKAPDFDRYESFKSDGIDLSALTKQESRYLRKDLQIIFQDPFSSLDPRAKVGDIIGEGLLVHGMFASKNDEGYKHAVIDVMEKCGLDASYINRYPHQFSGGQRQRIGIARALILNPKFIVADEAVSALDVSIQSQIINLLQELKDSLNLTYLFITHDLSVVRYISDRIGVMYFGRLVELASAKDIFDHPAHPYTKQLLNAIPELDKDESDKWEITYETKDYVFNYESDLSSDQDWLEVSPNHFVACTLKKVVIEDISGGDAWAYSQSIIFIRILTHAEAPSKPSTESHFHSKLGRP